MLRLSDKLLAILLALLLGLAPLQGVMGMTGGSSDQPTAAQQSVNGPDNGMTQSAKMANAAACPHCLSHHRCQGHQAHASSCQCSGCLVALPAVIPLVDMDSGGFTYAPTQARYVNRLHSSILRPPKA